MEGKNNNLLNMALGAIRSAPYELNDMENAADDWDLLDRIPKLTNITIQALQKSSDSSETSLSQEVSELKQRLLDAENIITDKNAFISHMNSILDSNDTSKSPKHTSPSHKARDLGLSDEEIFHAMEKKIKVQISNLQYLLDTLSEEKQRSAILHDQKQSLKEDLHSLKKQYSALETEYSALQMRNHTLTQSEANLNAALNDSNEKLQSLQAQYNDLTAQLTTANNLTQSLQAQNSELRQHLENTGIQLALLTSVSTGTGSTGGAHAKIEKLQARVRSLELETSELKLFQTASEEKLVYKQKRVDDLSNENMKLRQQCLSLREDIEQARILQLKKEAELKGIILKKERTIESLRVLVENLEDDINETREKLSSERDNCDALKELLVQYSEKDATTEELLFETRAQLENNHRDTSVSELEDKISSQRKMLESLQAEHTSLQQTHFAIQSQNIAYIQTIESMQQQVAWLEMKVKRSNPHNEHNGMENAPDEWDLLDVLQGAENQLESSASRPNKKLFQSPGGATPLGKDVFKVYMGNQLDLQESELANYEEMIENLVQQLEEAQHEKEETQSMLEQLQHENSDLKSQLTESETRISLQSQQHNISSEQYNKLQADFDDLQHEHATVITTLQTTQQQLDSLQQVHNTLESEYSVVASSSRTAEMRIVQLEEELRVNIERLQDAEAEMDNMAALQSAKPEACPDAFLCPISFEIMVDPVMCADGHTYERASIEYWLEQHDTSPKTNLILEDKVLRPNITLRGLIREYQS